MNCFGGGERDPRGRRRGRAWRARGQKSDDRPQQNDLHALPAGGPPLLPEVRHRGVVHRGHDSARPEGQLHLQDHRYTLPK